MKVAVIPNTIVAMVWDVDEVTGEVILVILLARVKRRTKRRTWSRGEREIYVCVYTGWLAGYLINVNASIQIILSPAASV